MIIKLKNLKCKTMLGIHPEERVKPRIVILNLLIEYDHAKAASSDKIADAVDYFTLEKTIVESLAKQTFALLETLAEHVAQLVMTFPSVQQVTVEIDKPGALLHSESVSVVHTVKR